MLQLIFLGIMFSITRSNLALPTQLAFLVLNGLGLLFATIFNVSTPDLYEHNAHHTIGWVVTWFMLAQFVMGILFTFSGRSENTRATVEERAGFLSVSVEAMAQHQQYHSSRNIQDYRWSGDSGQGTERTSMSPGRDLSPINYKDETSESENGNEEQSRPGKSSLFNIPMVDRFLATHVRKYASAQVIWIMEAFYGLIDRTILILGFVTFLTGGVTYAGIMRGPAVLNGLAHFIKGGIFFWYGLLTLGRWMGCFADFGWAWNAKLSRSQVGQWKSSVPSAEFTESFVIWLYGCTNVFLEHLAGWGSPWTAQDLEHVSISIMFFGGGTCGMLVESKKIRGFLNAQVSSMPICNDSHPQKVQVQQAEPKSYSTSLNPIPALIIMLLGIMMSSHHQDSMVSAMVHKQWGTLLVGFSLARGVTYVTMYLQPPSSIYPSRPPSELVASFCLISGGLVFMASNKDVVKIMEEHDLMAMFVFTVVVGVTALLMAWEIVVLAIKGWVFYRQQQTRSRY